MESATESPRDPFRALRLRLTARFTGLVLAILLVGATAFYLYMRQSLVTAAAGVNALATLSVLETMDDSGSGLVVREREFREELDELHVTLRLELVQVWSRGELLARDGRVATLLPVDGPEQEIREVDSHPMLVGRTRVGDKGVVVVGRREELLDDQLALLLRGLLLIVPLTLIGALGAGWVMAGQSIGPVRKAFHDQRAFMADASHELRTPLAIILTQSEVALDFGGTGHAALTVVARIARQLGRLVDDLLFLSRADAAVLLRRHRPFPLTVLLEESVESFVPLAKQKGQRLVVSIPAEPLNVVADPDQLQRLVGILLDNAVRYSVPGDIEVRVERAGRQITLTVEDRGPGMPPAFVGRAFDRFARGESELANAAEGSGLGLAIARAIVEAHAGTIVLGSELGRGTRVTVTLPIG